MSNYKIYNSDPTIVRQEINGNVVIIHPHTFVVLDRKLAVAMSAARPALEIQEATDAELKEYKERQKKQETREKKMKAEARKRAEEEAKADANAIAKKESRRKEEEKAKAKDQAKVKQDVIAEEQERIAELDSHLPTLVHSPAQQPVKSVEKTTKSSKAKVGNNKKEKKK